MIQEVTYPTGSLEFLRKLRGQAEATSDSPELSKCKLRVNIVGAGIGGLATAVALARRGHKVTVLEKSARLAEIGAGIQVPPNSCRFLLEWGVGEFLEGRATEPQSVFLRRWKDGEVIGRTKYIPEFKDNFDAPYFVIHRAHLHEALHHVAVQLGVQVKLGSNVKRIEAASGILELDNGTILDADLIVATDGVHSLARSHAFGGDALPEETGFVAFRCAIDTDDMKPDPDIAWMLDGPNQHLWIGHDTHVMCYPICAGKTFNMVVNKFDNSDPRSWNQEKSLQEMRDHLSDWDPKLQKVVDLVKSTLKWPLLAVPTLDRWVEGKAVILGDAAHCMIPYMAQGAATAVEDGAALAEALHRVQSRTEVADALSVWEAVRRKRGAQMQEASKLNTHLWHFADGPEQQARDEGMQPEVKGEPFITSPNQWSDPTTQRWCYGYDAEGEVRRAWATRQAAGELKRSDSAYREW